MSSNDLHHEIEAWASNLIARLGATERRKLARKIGTELRRANAKRIRANVGPDGMSWPPRKPEKRRRKKHKQKMYTGMAKAHNLKVRTQPDGVFIGFLGRVARIARVAQYGLYDEPIPGIRVKYDQRPLLGFNRADRDLITALLAEQLEGDA